MFDAYHQRELKSCNRSKKHPWAVKSRSEGGRRRMQRETCAQDIYRETGFTLGREGGRLARSNYPQALIQCDCCKWL